MHLGSTGHGRRLLKDDLIYEDDQSPVGEEDPHVVGIIDREKEGHTAVSVDEELLDTDWTLIANEIPNPGYVSSRANNEHLSHLQPSAFHLQSGIAVCLSGIELRSHMSFFKSDPRRLEVVLRACHLAPVEGDALTEGQFRELALKVAEKIVRNLNIILQEIETRPDFLGDLGRAIASIKCLLSSSQDHYENNALMNQKSSSSYSILSWTFAMVSGNLYRSTSPPTPTQNEQTTNLTASDDFTSAILFFAKLRGYDDERLGPSECLYLRDIFKLWTYNYIIRDWVFSCKLENKKFEDLERQLEDTVQELNKVVHQYFSILGMEIPDSPGNGSSPVTSPGSLRARARLIANQRAVEAKLNPSISNVSNAALSSEITSAVSTRTMRTQVHNILAVYKELLFLNVAQKAQRQQLRAKVSHSTGLKVDILGAVLESVLLDSDHAEAEADCDSTILSDAAAAKNSSQKLSPGKDFASLLQSWKDINSFKS